jgi:hypothetical protein
MNPCELQIVNMIHFREEDSQQTYRFSYIVKENVSTRTKHSNQPDNVDMCMLLPLFCLPFDDCYNRSSFIYCRVFVEQDATLM